MDLCHELTKVNLSGWSRIWVQVPLCLEDALQGGSVVWGVVEWKDEKFDEGWFGCVIKGGKSFGAFIDHWYFVVVTVHFFYLFMMFGYTFYQLIW